MASQLYAKSEVAEAWGGKAIWILQDVLLQYIEQTTAFRSDRFSSGDDGNVNMVVYRLDDADGEEGYRLSHDATLVGPSRNMDPADPDFSSMMGIGYMPPFSELKETLERTQSKARKPGDNKNWIDFKW